MKKTVWGASLAGLLVLGACGLATQPALAVQAAAAPTTQGAQPITTGKNPEKMDAGTTNSEEESYRHSPVVKTLAGLLHQPVERTATLFEDFNSGVVLLLVLYFLLKYVPKAFKSKRETIGKDLADARSATAMADERLKAVERKLAALDGEIDGLRTKFAHDAEQDGKRIEASLAAERERIVRGAEAEIAAAGAEAQRELKRFAAGLAVERALGRIALTPEQDRALIDDFAGSLGAELSPEGRRN